MKKPQKISKKRVDKTYTTSTPSDVITRFQALLRDEEARFVWSKVLQDNEVTFIYDMIANAEAQRNFIPTVAQGKWAVAIIEKINKTLTASKN